MSDYTYDELTEIKNTLGQRADKLRECIREARDSLTKGKLDHHEFNTTLTYYGEKQRELGKVLSLSSRTEELRDRNVN